MIILKKLKDIIIDDTFKMIVEDEKIYINHFKRMNILEDNHIYLDTKRKRIHIFGNNLKMKKLVKHEVLLSGDINKIEVEDV